MNKGAVTTCRMSVVRNCLAWVGVFALLSLLFAGTVDAQVTAPWYRINYNTPAYVLYKPQDVAQYATSRAAANGYCVQNGMSIFSAELPAKDNNFASDTAKELGGTGYFTYTGSSAEPVPSFARFCTQLQPNPSSTPNSIKCGFTFRFGLLTIIDTMLLGNQPGVAQYYSLYPNVWGAGNANTGYAVEWDTTRLNPRGYYFMAVTGLTDTVGRHVNVDATVSASDSYVTASKFAIYCESQSFLGYVPVPTVLVQPTFVKGYKDLTWAQEHWWVVFLIIAIFILIVLLTILIYCCLTRTPPKEQPPIAPMVLREHNGSAYVNVLDDGSSKPHNAADAPHQRGLMPETYQQGADILMGPKPAVDPEALIQAKPSIFVREETLQTADGDSVALENEDEELNEKETS
ncbi:conserved hypothetical protein [Leishmania major strain Friedlin]|uniref:Membrane-associated protein n=1 Tax=Leishmania major TaxID=5664 RepID=E9AFA3_LEIMA|nr:conserved hypothetical protein [Leishmania major strain Friedlin]CAG9582632.1 hypothetical_protein_-_conserved [Leishmania major strain Friedlin]CBZ12907.1 conserved hypothetical protein [Leishmania major strain Friedlin]|eukprot:XP_003722673.1 conserved hypothetical protein [Leishmania major strain Friedlin]